MFYREIIPRPSRMKAEPGILPSVDTRWSPTIADIAARNWVSHPLTILECASQLSTIYVFPSRAEDLQVLTCRAESQCQDASAHYLLGTLYFSKG